MKRLLPLLLLTGCLTPENDPLPAATEAADALNGALVAAAQGNPETFTQQLLVLEDRVDETLNRVKELSEDSVARARGAAEELSGRATDRLPDYATGGGIGAALATAVLGFLQYRQRRKNSLVGTQRRA